MTTALSLPLLGLSDDESELLGRLRAQVSRFALKNQRKDRFYAGKHQARHLDIAVPPHLTDLEVRVGIPAIVTDALAERIEWDGWSSASGDLMGLDEVYDANSMDLEQGRGTLDALVAGVSFVTVGKGDESDGEPEILVTAESPSSATGLWDRRKRRLTCGLSQSRNEFGTVVMESLYLPGETIRLERNGPIGGQLSVVDRDRHGLGRVPMVRLTNQERAADDGGRSEITPPVRYLTEAVARAMLRMEISAEFFSAPQRYGLGVDPEQFGISADDPRSERVRKGWEVAMSRMNFIPRDEDFPDQLPKMEQFSAALPTPHIELIRACLQIVAAEGALPSQYVGILTDNPPSADAIRAQEARLVRRAKFRQRMFGKAWREVAFLALLVRDTVVDSDAFAGVGVNWLDPSTPTPAAAADETSKLIGAGVLPADSAVTYRRVGLSTKDQEQVASDKRRASNSVVRDRLAAAAAQAAQDPAVTDIVGQRGGFAG